MKTKLSYMHSRRIFLKQTGLSLASAITIPAAVKASVRNNFKLGLQLFTIREAMAKDLRGTFKQIAAMGYQEVETYGFNYGNNKYDLGPGAETGQSASQRLRLDHLVGPL